MTILLSLVFASFMQKNIYMGEQYGPCLFLCFKIDSKGEKLLSEVFSCFGTQELFLKLLAKQLKYFSIFLCHSLNMKFLMLKSFCKNSSTTSSSFTLISSPFNNLSPATVSLITKSYYFNKTRFVFHKPILI